jgi:succinate dehydrogenase / fumarate reductase, cytochrome b subunit
VYSIHSLGAALPVIEWGFIFLPLLFHAVIGVVIIRGGLPNTASYPYTSNFRYTLQRVSGIIALAFILWHVFHMHGWLHFDPWLSAARQWGGAQFRPFNAASSAGAALADGVVMVLYAIGTLAVVYHLANGIWTAGITWGVWVSPAAQRRASYGCAVFGVLLAAVGMGALAGMANVDRQHAREIEDRMYDARVTSGEISPAEHKRSER